MKTQTSEFIQHELKLINERIDLVQKVQVQNQMPLYELEAQLQQKVNEKFATAFTLLFQELEKEKKQQNLYHINRFQSKQINIQPALQQLLEENKIFNQNLLEQMNSMGKSWQDEQKFWGQKLQFLQNFLGLIGNDGQEFGFQNLQQFVKHLIQQYMPSIYEQLQIKLVSNFEQLIEQQKTKTSDQDLKIQDLTKLIDQISNMFYSNNTQSVQIVFDKQQKTIAALSEQLQQIQNDEKQKLLYEKFNQQLSQINERMFQQTQYIDEKVEFQQSVQSIQDKQIESLTQDMEQIKNDLECFNLQNANNNSKQIEQLQLINQLQEQIQKIQSQEKSILHKNIIEPVVIVEDKSNQQFENQKYIDSTNQQNQQKQSYEQKQFIFSNNNDSQNAGVNQCIEGFNPASQKQSRILPQQYQFNQYSQNNAKTNQQNFPFNQVPIQNQVQNNNPNFTLNVDCQNQQKQSQGVPVLNQNFQINANQPPQNLNRIQFQTMISNQKPSNNLMVQNPGQQCDNLQSNQQSQFQSQLQGKNNFSDRPNQQQSSIKLNQQEKQNVEIRILNVQRQTYVKEFINQIYEATSRIRTAQGEQQAFVKQIQDFNELCVYYNFRNVQTKRNLKQHCTSFRQAREDGNCFYTSFGFQYFQMLLIKFNDQLFQRSFFKLKQSLDQIDFEIKYNGILVKDKALGQNIYNEFLDRIQQLRNIPNVQEREDKFCQYFAQYQQDEQNNFNDGCLSALSGIYIRNLAYYIVQNSKIKDTVYDKETLLEWEKECNSNEVIILLLSQYLEIQSHLIFFNEQDFILRIYNEEALPDHKIILLISLAVIILELNLLPEQTELIQRIYIVFDKTNFINTQIVIIKISKIFCTPSKQEKKCNSIQILILYKNKTILTYFWQKNILVESEYWIPIKEQKLSNQKIHHIFHFLSFQFEIHLNRQIDKIKLLQNKLQLLLFIIIFNYKYILLNYYYSIIVKIQFLNKERNLNVLSLLVVVTSFLKNKIKV